MVADVGDASIDSTRPTSEGSLLDLAVGATARITNIGGDRAMTRRVLALGLRQGAEVTVTIDDDPTVVASYDIGSVAAYDDWFVPFLGFFLLPWTTLAYAAMWGTGTDGVLGFAALPDDRPITLRVWTSAGELVYERQETRGRQTWDGENLGGKLAESGIYLVTAYSTGDERTVWEGKVAVIR